MSRYPALLVCLSLVLAGCQRKQPEPVPGPQSHGTPPAGAPAGHQHGRVFRF